MQNNFPIHPRGHLAIGPSRIRLAQTFHCSRLGLFPALQPRPDFMRDSRIRGLQALQLGIQAAAHNERRELSRKQIERPQRQRYQQNYRDHPDEHVSHN